MSERSVNEDRLMDVSFSEGGKDPDEIVKMEGWQGIDDATSKEIAIVYVYETLEDKARFIQEHPDLEISKNGNEGVRNPQQGGLLDAFVSDPTQAKWYRDAVEGKDRGPAPEIETWTKLGLPTFLPTGERIYLRVRFETAEDRDAYAQVDSLQIAKKTRGVLSCWWPPRPREDLSSLRFDVGTETVPQRAKYTDVDVPVGQDPLFGDQTTIRKRLWHEDVLIGSKIRVLNDTEVEAYCWYGDHWLPATRSFWYSYRGVIDTLHLESRCKSCARLYRRGSGVLTYSPLAMPRYPIYIPSKGRHQEDRALTIKVLLRDKVPFYVVVEPEEEAEYVARAGKEHVLVLPFSNLGLGSIPARNWLKAHATANGAARHWILDDNLIEFRRLWKGRRIPCHAGVALRVCEDLTDAHENVAISGLNYQMFVPSETPIPFYRNVHVYSCVAPDTSILCADLVWRPAGTLQKGQRIVAFDEEPSPNARNLRSYRTAIIERNEPAQKPCYQINTDRGIPVVASEEHPWLVCRRPPLKRRYRDRLKGETSSRHPRLCWASTSDLQVGDQIAHLSKPWIQDETHDGGWISGMFDGEGSLSLALDSRSQRVRGVGIGIAQKEGPVLDRLRSVLSERGYSVRMSGREDRSDGTYIRGGFPEMMRFAGEFRPTRILSRAADLWEGRTLWSGSTYELATITSIRPIGDQPVASITTSTGTFITGGYLTHNCILIDNAATGRNGEVLKWRGRYNEDTDLCLQALDAGYCTILMNAFMANKLASMAMKGGNTDELYADDGRLKMAKNLEEAWPGIVSTRWKFGRPQHSVRWDKFDQSLRLRKPGQLSGGEYGLSLRAIGEVGSPTLRKLLEEYDGP